MNIGRNALSDTFTQHLCRFVERQRMYSGYSAQNEHDLAHLIAFQFNPIHFKAFQSKYTTYLNLLFCTYIVHTFAVSLMCLRGFLCLQSTKFSPVLCVCDMLLLNAYLTHQVVASKIHQLQDIVAHICVPIFIVIASIYDVHLVLCTLECDSQKLKWDTSTNYRISLSIIFVWFFRMSHSIVHENFYHNALSSLTCRQLEFQLFLVFSFWYFVLLSFKKKEGRTIKKR